MNGTVKSVLATRGFFFIRPDQGDPAGFLLTLMIWPSMRTS
jgi:hypothetical protein